VGMVLALRFMRHLPIALRATARLELHDPFSVPRGKWCYGTMTVNQPSQDLFWNGYP
jgi:hypothetical protein